MIKAKKTTKNIKKAFRVSVIFRREGGWSPGYYYQSSKAIALGLDLVVPTGDYFSVAKVIKCETIPSIDMKDLKKVRMILR
jgi:hypothetical protein